VTSKGSLHGQLQRALDVGDLPRAGALASELPQVPLPIALRLALLILDQEPSRGAARRLVARLAVERSPSLHTLAGAAWALARLGSESNSHARAELDAIFSS
jgi:hypothetical protein